jgi:ferritin
MISKKMNDAMNDQITAEFYSAHLYLGMSAYLDSIDLPGFANWMRVQYQEEKFHAEKMFDHVLERDGRIVLGQFEAPPFEWGSVLEVFEEAFKHEQKVTSLINNLVNIAVAEKDHASNNFLLWYVDEQVEEEASAKAIVQQLRMVNDSKSGLFMMDREMSARAFTPPAANAGE